MDACVLPERRESRAAAAAESVDVVIVERVE
jgi:hypothetical protein